MPPPDLAEVALSSDDGDGLVVQLKDFPAKRSVEAEEQVSPIQTYGKHT